MYRFADDYRVALQQSYMWTTQQDLPDAQGFFARPQRRRRSTRTKTLVHTLSFWCLNPAVVRATVFSVVLLKSHLDVVGMSMNPKLLWLVMCVTTGIFRSERLSAEYCADLGHPLSHGLLFL